MKNEEVAKKIAIIKAKIKKKGREALYEEYARKEPASGAFTDKPQQVGEK